MRIAIDYDGTYTADTDLWDEWIKQAVGRGHEVICVTMRHSHEPIDRPIPCEVIYTSRKAKAFYMSAIDRYPDIWIDDHPQWIFENAI